MSYLINYNKPFSVEKTTILRRDLLEWFEKNGRHWIPWKFSFDGSPVKDEEQINPYPIWIAEVMLQQTQLKTVLPFWKKWMITFPTLEDLAVADEEKVLLIWQGLGYYSRAKRIHQSSQILLKSIGNNSSLNLNSWPRSIEFWMNLPGLGRTTSASILSSAFNEPYPILDGNVQRVLARLTANDRPISKELSNLWALSTKLLDSKKPRNFNQALMDLGSQICTVHNPDCLRCPWHSNCIASLLDQSTRFPMKQSKKQLPFNVIGVGVIFNGHGDVLIDKRLDQGQLAGMWEFPGGKQEKDELIESTIAREIKEELDITIEILEKLIDFQHSYTHIKLRFKVYICQWIEGDPKPLASQEIKWVNPQELSKYAFPAANSKIIKALDDYLTLNKNP